MRAINRLHNGRGAVSGDNGYYLAGVSVLCPAPVYLCNYVRRSGSAMHCEIYGVFVGPAIASSKVSYIVVEDIACTGRWELQLGKSGYVRVLLKYLR